MGRIHGDQRLQRQPYIVQKGLYRVSQGPQRYHPPASQLQRGRHHLRHRRHRHRRIRKRGRYVGRTHRLVLLNGPHRAFTKSRNGGPEHAIRRLRRAGLFSRIHGFLHPGKSHGLRLDHKAVPTRGSVVGLAHRANALQPENDPLGGPRYHVRGKCGHLHSNERRRGFQAVVAHHIELRLARQSRRYLGPGIASA